MAKFIDDLNIFLTKILTNQKAKQREKKFWKLRQLDRVEYMLHAKSIGESFQSAFSPTLNYLLIVNVFALFFSMLVYIAFESVAVIEVLPVILKYSLWFLGVILFVDIINYFSKTKAIFKLRERFDLNYVY